MATGLVHLRILVVVGPCLHRVFSYGSFFHRVQISADSRFLAEYLCVCQGEGPLLSGS